MIKKIYIFLFLVQIGCLSVKDNEQKDTHIGMTQSGGKYYKDFDLFKVQGINPISDVFYPYVYLSQNSEDSLNMEVHYKRDKKFLQKFWKEDNKWESEFSRYDHDSGRSEKHKFHHKNDSIISFEYASTNGSIFYLTEVTTITLESKHSDIFSFFDSIQLSAETLDAVPFEKRFSSSDDLYFVDGKILKEFSTIYNYELDKVMLESEDCYNLEDASFFWFQFLPSKYRLENCK